MKAIEKAAAQRYYGDNVTTGSIITAFLDAILADPEAMERIEAQTPGYVGMTIEALKQEAER